MQAQRLPPAAQFAGWQAQSRQRVTVSYAQLNSPGPSASASSSVPRPPVSSSSAASTSGRVLLPNGSPASPVSRTSAVHATAVATPAAVVLSEPSTSFASIPRDDKGAPLIYVGSQRVHSLTDRGREVITDMRGWAADTLPRYLKNTDVNWQPSDMLPDPSADTFFDEVSSLRAAASNLPDDYMVVLVGDMVTEEALPSYMNMLNLLDGTQDVTGASDEPWACWTRAWTAEENRHGDLLNKYLYLSGRVDMRAVESSIQRLIGNGLDPQLENNPYLCFIYTSFQERATKVSHGNTARLAMYHGDRALAKICGLIAADEARHEQAYTAIVAEIMRHDPEGVLLAFEDMMKKGILMPAHYVDDGWHSEANAGQNLFVDYATVADSLGVYTTHDYANIVDHLVKRWGVADLRVHGAAAGAQDYLCHHAQRIRRLADLQMERRLREKKRGRARGAAFSWIFKRELQLV